MLYVNPMTTLSASRQGDVLQAASREEMALKEFEQYLFYTMLQEMRKSIPKGGLFDGGRSQEIFEQMFDDALSAEMAKSGQFGIAQQIADQLRVAELKDTLQEASAEQPDRKDTTLGQ